MSLGNVPQLTLPVTEFPRGTQTYSPSHKESYRPGAPTYSHFNTESQPTLPLTQASGPGALTYFLYTESRMAGAPTYSPLTEFPRPGASTYTPSHTESRKPGA